MGGAVTAGETSQEGAGRELYEELGLKVDFTGRVPRMSVNSPSVFDDIYVVTLDTVPESLVLQASEVEQAKWADMEEVKEKITDGSFIPYPLSLIQLLFDLKDLRDIHTRRDISVPAETAPMAKP